MYTPMVFERYERKYLLSPSAKDAVLQAMEGRMEIDMYGRTTIRNIYFDTDGYDLIRRSLSGPEYKEKLRIRSYRQVGAKDDVFVELKKKYKGIVYKRRIEVPAFQAMDWLLAGGEKPDISTASEQANFRQIRDEIDYFLRRYERSGMGPKVFLSYEREAYAPVSGSEDDIRITFDTNILARGKDLLLSSPAYGDPVLDQGLTIMEVKVPRDGAIPMWLARTLSENGIVKSSFSKYGKYYMETAGARQKIIGTLFREDIPELDMKGELLYV